MVRKEADATSDIKLHSWPGYKHAVCWYLDTNQVTTNYGTRGIVVMEADHKLRAIISTAFTFSSLYVEANTL